MSIRIPRVKLVDLVALLHDLHQLLVHQPRSVPFHVQLAGELETGDVVLG